MERLRQPIVITTVTLYSLMGGCSSVTQSVVSDPGPGEPEYTLKQVTLGGRSVMLPAGYGIGMPEMDAGGTLDIYLDAPGGLEGLLTTNGGTYGPYVLNMSVNTSSVAPPVEGYAGAWMAGYTTNTERGLVSFFREIKQSIIAIMGFKWLMNRDDNRTLETVSGNEADVLTSLPGLP